ncbi:MAG: hypothetical protein H7A41_07790 [Chlamydiales bacterium]|nr:hypothetical protein [Chlamydiales bacterium]
MKRDLAIEDGFQIIMLFLRDFWWEFLKGIMVKRELICPEVNKVRNKKGTLKCVSKKDKLHDDNDFFFLVVCDGTSDDYFEKVIEQRMNIPPIEQHDALVVHEDTLFQLAIDFCEYFNKRFQEEGRDSLRFAIDWLEEMRKQPEEHKTEWEIWNQVIIDVIENGQKSLGFF